MKEEKRIFYKTLNNIVATNRIDNEETYIINNYVSRLEYIIKEALDKLTIKQIRFINEKDYVLDDNDLDEIMKILDKGEDNE